jgi:hypothetical protein
MYQHDSVASKQTAATILPYYIHVCNKQDVLFLLDSIMQKIEKTETKQNVSVCILFFNLNLRIHEAYATLSNPFHISTVVY